MPIPLLGPWQYKCTPKPHTCTCRGWEKLIYPKGKYYYANSTWSASFNCCFPLFAFLLVFQSFIDDLDNWNAESLQRNNGSTYHHSNIDATLLISIITEVMPAHQIITHILDCHLICPNLKFQEESQDSWLNEDKWSQLTALKTKNGNLQNDP